MTDREAEVVVGVARICDISMTPPFVFAAPTATSRQFQEGTMGDTQRFKDFEDYARRTIRKKSMQMIRRLGFKASEREDIEQEIMLHLLQNLHSYDPARGTMKTFIVCVVQSKVRSMIRARIRHHGAMRDPVFSLNEKVIDDYGCIFERAESMDREEYLIHAGLLRRPAFEQRELCVDVERLICTLPPELQQICELLKTRNVTQISKRTGASRQHIYAAIRKLRGIFDEAGIREYL